MPANPVKKVAGSVVRLSMRGLERGPHITRYSMYRRLARFQVAGPRQARTLSISHSEELCRLLGLPEAHILKADYPEYNMLALPFEDGAFDYVVSDQVLEHVEGNPQDAIDESFRVLKPGGVAVHTTCFINPIHGEPSDFWRFTPDALALLCKKFSRIIEVGGWGNPYVWLVAWLGLRFDGIPEAQWHPLHKLATFNHPKWPVVTWVIAQK